MMNRKTFSRRRILRAAGGIAVALPWLESYRAHAQGATKRFIVWFWPEGVGFDERKNFAGTSRWWPAAGATPESFTFPALTQPFEAIRQDMILIHGVDHLAAGGNDHNKSMGIMLTGGRGDSVDQVIARQIGKNSRFSSLEFAVKPDGTGAKSRMIFSGGRAIPPEDNPARMFARLFGSGTTPATGSAANVMFDDSAIKALVARRKSVLDAVRGEIDVVKREVSGDDLARLDAHLTSLRELEKSFAAPPPPSSGGASCSGGTAPAALTEFDQIGKAQMDLLALAIACNLSPVASLQWSRSGSFEHYTFLGGNVDHHGLAHHNGSGNNTALLTKVMTWYSEQLVYLVKKLKSVNEGGRSLLDNCVIMGCSHFGTGAYHTTGNVPYFLVGSGGGYFKTGRYLRVGSQSHEKLFASVADAFGANFGSAGALPGLR